MAESKAGEDVADASPSVDGGGEQHGSALGSLLPHIIGLLKHEPALAITVAYLFVAMAGIFYSYRYYALFAIPVMTLSQISDFLVAGIQQPIALLLVLSTLPLVWLLDKANTYFRAHHSRRAERLQAMARRSGL